jgi:hypothetical protein
MFAEVAGIWSRVTKSFARLKSKKGFAYKFWFAVAHQTRRSPLAIASNEAMTLRSSNPSRD